jgi:hypothetical protein
MSSASSSRAMSEGMVTPAEIRWCPVCAPPPVEDRDVADLLSLDPVDLLSYAADCREDLRAVRETLSEALALIATQRQQLARAARLIDLQRRQLRDRGGAA